MSIEAEFDLIKIKNNYRIYNFELTKKLVMQNLGIGWGPKKCIEQELKNNTLYELNFDFETPNTKFSITYNEKSLTESSKKFLTTLKKEIKDSVR